MLAVGHYVPRLYYRIVVLVGQLLSTVFWVVGWAWAAVSDPFFLPRSHPGSFSLFQAPHKSTQELTLSVPVMGCLCTVL